GMDAVGANKDIAARSVHMHAVAIEEERTDAAFILTERAEPAAGADRVRAEALDHGLMDHALQAAAMDRKLRHLVAGIEAALLVPDLLAVAREIEQLEGADGGGIELVQKAEAGKLADGMRQGVDADAELADRVGLLVQFAIDAARAQPQGRGEAAYSATDNDRLHRPLLRTKPGAAQAQAGGCHGPLLRRKRLCPLRLQLDPGLGLSLNLKVFEILPIAHAVAENLLLAGQVLHRA